MDFGTAPPKLSLPRLPPLALRYHHSPAALQHSFLASRELSLPLARPPAAGRSGTVMRSLSMPPEQEKRSVRVGGVSSERREQPGFPRKAPLACGDQQRSLPGSARQEDASL